MYHVSTQGIDERMINVHYYYYLKQISDWAHHHIKRSDPYVSILKRLRLRAFLVSDSQWHFTTSTNSHKKHTALYAILTQLHTLCVWRSGEVL